MGSLLSTLLGQGEPVPAYHGCKWHERWIDGETLCARVRMVKDVGFRSKQDSLELDSFIAPEISQLNEAIKKKETSCQSRTAYYKHATERNYKIIPSLQSIQNVYIYYEIFTVFPPS